MKLSEWGEEESTVVIGAGCGYRGTAELEAVFNLVARENLRGDSEVPPVSRKVQNRVAGTQLPSNPR